MARDRRRFLAGAGATGLAAMAGCVQGFGDEGGESNANIGMVYATGGLDDGSFNDMAHEGIKQAESELGISFEYTEPESEGEFEGAQRDYAEGDEYDLVCCIGYAQHSALSDIAPQYPDQDFIIVDSVLEEDNVRSYTFGEPEGSFLVGQLAALLSDTEFAAGDGETDPDESTVGFVGGTKSALIESFQAGFEAGVEHADTGTEVVSNYVGDFNDTGTGKATAQSMYQQGADVVYHAAGRTGVGVFQAASEEGRFAIGVDADQSQTQPDFADVILASMVKYVDLAVLSAVESVVDDSFAGGETERLSLEEEGVVAKYGATLGDEIPGEIKDAVDESRQAIIDGEIDVPTEL